VGFGVCFNVFISEKRVKNGPYHDCSKGLTSRTLLASGAGQRCCLGRCGTKHSHDTWARFST
jgi:hypothetical protein